MANVFTSLSARIAAEAEAATQKAKQSAETLSEIAAAWDAAGFTGMQPWHATGSKGIYGDCATLSFKDVGPDDLVQLMWAFPAIPRVNYSHAGTRYFHPEGAQKMPAGVLPVHCDGYEIEISGGHGYDSFRASWSAMVGDVQTHFRADLRRVHYLHPRAHRRVVEFQGQFLRFEGPASLVWPKDSPQSGQWQAYGYCTEGSGDFRIRGANVLALAESWEAEANRRNDETKAAFERTYVGIVGFPTAESVTRTAEKIRATYEAKKGGLRAGTLEQTAALETSEALADKAVAEKHWKAYAEQHGIESSQSYFDHYAWACAMLKRCDLYEVQLNGKAYRYGTAWL